MLSKSALIQQIQQFQGRWPEQQIAQYRKLIQTMSTEPTSSSPQILIQVYLDDGIVYEYTVDDPIKAREHTSAIIKTGYRHTDNDKGVMEHYPPHRIHKVKCTGGMSPQYTDCARGT